MPKFDKAESESKLEELIRTYLPQAHLVGVSVQESANFEGEPSLAVQAIFRELPEGGVSRPMARVLDQFRTWLSTEKDEERFPYIRIFSEEEAGDRGGTSPESRPPA